MSDTDTGKLVKLKIESYEKSDQSGSPVGTFEAFYNPSTFTSSYALKYNEKAAEGQTKKEMEYGGYEPATFSFELLLDGTGASAPNASTNPTATVPTKIKEFMDVVYGFNSSSHRASYLKVIWGGSTIDKCVLTGVNFTYDLFSPNGDPLRAKLACSFKEYSYEELIKAEEGKQSPDVTHIRVVQQGDRLPTMCERIYGDAKLYLQVARANNLLDYRNLVPGSKIFFPPLAKN